MRVVWLTGFGGPEVLVPGTAEDPVAGQGQVVVDVAFANITFVETQFRATGAGPFRGTTPMIPGNGVGGVVASVGAGVDAGLLGVRVVTSTGGSGGYAERVAVDADALFPVPDGVDLDVAVALLADGRTATMLVETAGVTAGDRVLVEAAAGGVGGLLVQLAAAAGATVVAVAGGARKVSLAEELGAPVAVDYLGPGWPDDVRAAVTEVDVVFDGVGGATARSAFDLLAPGGRMVSYGLASGMWADVTDEEAAARGVTLIHPQPTPQQLRAWTESALSAAAGGRLRPVIGQRYALSDAAAAHAAIESRATLGKTLLEVRPQRQVAESTPEGAGRKA